MENKPVNDTQHKMYWLDSDGAVLQSLMQEANIV